MSFGERAVQATIEPVDNRRNARRVREASVHSQPDLTPGGRSCHNSDLRYDDQTEGVPISHDFLPRALAINVRMRSASLAEIDSSLSSVRRVSDQNLIESAIILFHP